MRNDDSYEAYKRKFNLGVVGVIILMLVLWFGNFDGSNHNWELLVKNIGTTKATYRCSDSSITDLITDLFWDEHNQEMLEKYVKEEREWESTHEYDHFLEDLGLYSVICLDGCIGCAPWRTFGCTTVVVVKENAFSNKFVGIFVRLFDNVTLIRLLQDSNTPCSI